MSNPAVCFLIRTEFRGVPFCIEDNLGESIHIHYGMIRIVLSIDDFFIFVDNIRNAAKQLFELKDLIWDEFDIDSLKYEWIEHYAKIKGKKSKSVRLDSLFMKESFRKKRSIKRIIPLQESGYIGLLQGDFADIDYYSESGKYEPSRKEKVEAIQKLIDCVGYPFEQKTILINQEGYILDGVKRASYLYYKFGGETEIVVDEIDLPGLEPIDVRRNKAEKEISKWLSSQKRQNCEKEINKCVSSNYHTSLENIIKKLKDSDIKFYIVNKDKSIGDEQQICGIIIIEDHRFNSANEIFGNNQAATHPYEGYSYLYGSKRPLAIETGSGTVLVCDKPMCKSRFEKELLPMDQYVIELSWKHIIWNYELECYQLDSKMLSFWTILDSMLEFNRFSVSDIHLIEENREILETSEFIKAFEKEFFRYTPSLINYLLSRQYNKAVQMYEQFSDY